MLKVLLMISGAFYALLCVFSIVTGLIYMTGKRELNPLELSDRMTEKLSDLGTRRKFAVKMGFVTFAVGIVQGITAWAVFRHQGTAMFVTALGFTLFSIASVAVKLHWKVSIFALVKAAAYIGILLVLIAGRVRGMF